MAARSQIPLRPKLFHHNTDLLTGAKQNTAVHGHLSEYALGSVGVCTSMTFLIGSIFFFDIWPVWVIEVGDWLYILGSLLTLLLALWAMYEAWHANTHHDADKEEKQRDELMENLNFVLASIIFSVGSVFFMPGVYSGPDEELAGHEIGAWCFVFGSFGFVLASFWNAVGMASEHGHRQLPDAAQATCFQLSKVSLCLAMVGGVLFVTGSFLYRPGYTNTHGCGRSAKRGAVPSPAVMQLSLKPLLPAPESSSGKWPNQQGLKGFAAIDMFKAHRLHQTSRRSRAVLSPNEVGQLKPVSLAAVEPETSTCTNAAQDGTWLYVIGSLCFLIQSVLSLASSVIMHRSVSQQSPGGGMLQEAGRQHQGQQSSLASSSA
mmetsp:Transcript_51955/g.150945  ORF Transcript_51955/g.150945 Transcript_51955/m.150945 type:complete len:375 (+) Transcript_51955:99-1223(+)